MRFSALTSDDGSAGLVRVVGVDGCPGGWVAVALDVERRTFESGVHCGFRQLLDTYPDAAAIAVDIPIGLAEGEPRQCDIEARGRLGPRRSSVFPAPDPRVLNTATYADALELSRELTSKGISRQAFAIYPKVAEVNRVLTPELQKRVIEVHPEVSFWALAGERPMEYRKSKSEGFEERRALLASGLDGVTIPTRPEARQLARPAKPDDVLDAFVAAWTAHRFAEGHAGRLPDEPPTDARGLRMGIVY